MSRKEYGPDDYVRMVRCNARAPFIAYDCEDKWTMMSEPHASIKSVIRQVIKTFIRQGKQESASFIVRDVLGLEAVAGAYCKVQSPRIREESPRCCAILV